MTYNDLQSYNGMSYIEQTAANIYDILANKEKDKPEQIRFIKTYFIKCGVLLIGSIRVFRGVAMGYNESLYHFPFHFPFLSMRSC